MATFPIFRAFQTVIHHFLFSVSDTKPENNQFMGYCVKQDMIDRFGEEDMIRLTNEDNIENINDDKLQQAIVAASTEMGAYLIKYLPLPAVHPSLVRMACHITRYNLYGESATEHVKKLYADSISFLKCVSKGDISLGPVPMGN